MGWGVLVENRSGTGGTVSGTLADGRSIDATYVTDASSRVLETTPVAISVINSKQDGPGGSQVDDGDSAITVLNAPMAVPTLSTWALLLLSLSLLVLGAVGAVHDCAAARSDASVVNGLGALTGSGALFMSKPAEMPDAGASAQTSRVRVRLRPGYPS